MNLELPALTVTSTVSPPPLRRNSDWVGFEMDVPSGEARAEAANNDTSSMAHPPRKLVGAIRHSRDLRVLLESAASSNFVTEALEAPSASGLASAALLRGLHPRSRTNDTAGRSRGRGDALSHRLSQLLVKYAPRSLSLALTRAVLPTHTRNVGRGPCTWRAHERTHPTDAPTGETEHATIPTPARGRHASSTRSAEREQ